MFTNFFILIIIKLVKNFKFTVTLHIKSLRNQKGTFQNLEKIFEMFY